MSKALTATHEFAGLRLTRDQILEAAGTQRVSKRRAYNYMLTRLDKSLAGTNASFLEKEFAQVTNWFDVSTWLLRGSGFQTIFFFAFILPMIVVEVIIMISEATGITRDRLVIASWLYMPLDDFLREPAKYSEIAVPDELYKLRHRLGDIAAANNYEVTFRIAREGLDPVIVMCWVNGSFTTRSDVIFVYDESGIVRL